MSVVLVAAVARDGVIGRDGGMPWHLPEDLAHFKAKTLGTTMIMGRRTFDSIGRPLPGRRTIVVTRQSDWSVAGVDVAADPASALAMAGEHVTVVGGGQIYAQLLERADGLEITHIDRDLTGDTVFPDIDPQLWEATDTRQADTPDLTFVSYRRRASVPAST